MTWMQRLKRIFNIDIEQCEHCGGHVKVVACIEDSALMPNTLAMLAGQALEKILQHLALKESPSLARVNDARGPPDQAALFQR